MTIYARIASVMIVVAVAIIILGLTIGAYFLTRYMSGAIEKDMMIVVDIAEKYVTNEIALLKVQAEKAAQKADLSYKTGKHSQALAHVLSEHPVFIGLAVFDKKTLLDSSGIFPARANLPDEPFMDIARSGGRAISSTMHGSDGTLVMYVSAPMENGLVLAAVLPGQYFSQLLSQFTVYQTGHLFIDDAAGHVIANIRPEWVQQRINFIEIAKTDSRYKELGAFVERGISGEQGTSHFTVDGVPRICAFHPLSSPDEKWFVGVVAPLAESPLKEIPAGMIIVGMITFALSVVVALLGARLLKHPYMEMEHLRGAAVAASKAKTSFLATMSHEIRTPLNAVIGLSEVALNEKSLSRETESNIEKIHSAGSTILSIVNDILDISKIDFGKFELSPVQYDTPSLINDTVALNLMRIEGKNIVFKLDVDENLPKMLCGDDLRIKQIFSNLLSNAFKYTHSGTVEWRVSFERNGEDFWIVSSVRDTGIGIKQEGMQKIFSDYAQVDTKANRKVEGIGLGLAISKRLVEMMDGTITVESVYGKGTAFHVRLRQVLVSDAPIGKSVAQNLMDLRYTFSKWNNFMKLERANLSYAKVLVVDDVETNIAVAKGMMKPYGMQVDGVNSGQRAIEIIRALEPRYSAIFMDHMMPGMDGVEATRIIREDIGTDYARTIPIIALTANAIVGSEEIFLRKGFQGFISKPIDAAKLDAILQRWVRDKSLEETPSEEDKAVSGKK